jgi:mono/diheme cytochrome c family protein
MSLSKPAMLTLLLASCANAEPPREQSFEHTVDDSECCEPRRPAADASTRDASSDQTSPKRDSGRPAQRTAQRDAAIDVHSLADAATGEAGILASQATIPCDVAEVLSRHCATCHGKTPTAPMQLLSADDFAAHTTRDDKARVYERALLRIHDGEKPMPPRSAPDKLAAAELATLDGWLKRAAPPSAEGCAVRSNEGEVAVPFDRSECEFDFELRVHGAGGADGFVVPEGADVYECFNFQIPWDTQTHGLRFEPLIDNRDVMHHWTLSTIPQKLAPGSAPGGCPWGERTQLAGWAPGSLGTVLPKDVGIRMPSGTGSTFQFEIHYNNVGKSERVVDRSGVRVCATSKLRKNEAVPVVLGGLCFGPLCSGLPIGKSQVKNTCLNLSQTGPAHVLWTSPHMHKLGRHLKTEITRKDGGVETLTDRDYDYNDQRDYPSDMLIHAGDALTTTCTFDNDTQAVVPYGESTQEEMCFNFLMVYPPDSISTIDGFCLGL